MGFLENTGIGKISFTPLMGRHASTLLLSQRVNFNPLFKIIAEFELTFTISFRWSVAGRAWSLSRGCSLARLRLSHILVVVLEYQRRQTDQLGARIRAASFENPHNLKPLTITTLKQNWEWEKIIRSLRNNEFVFGGFNSRRRGWQWELRILKILFFLRELSIVLSSRLTKLTAFKFNN